MNKPTKTIKLYQRTYTLPVLAGGELDQLHSSIRDRSQVLRKGYRMVEKVTEEKAGWFGKKEVRQRVREPLSFEERYQELDNLVQNYDRIIATLTEHQAEYQQFFYGLSQEIQEIVAVKCRAIAKLERERLQLETSARSNDDPDLLQVTASQKAQLLQTARTVGFAAILMIKKLELMSQSLEKIAGDQETQRQVLAEMVRKLGIQRQAYELQRKINRLQAEAAEMANVALNFEQYMEQFLGSFQSLLANVSQVDGDLAGAVRQIQDIANRMLNEQANGLPAQDPGSEKILDFLLAGQVQKDRLLAALERSRQTNHEVEFDLEVEVIGQRETSLANCLENIQTYVGFQLAPALQEVQKKMEAERQRQAEEQRKAADAERQRLISQTTGTDYGKLDRALRNRQWKEADELTRTLMLKVANRTVEGYLDSNSITKFPGEDLKLIDRLWVDHSDGKLGFSVQKRIWKECGSPGGNYSANQAAWKKFGQRVNWQGGTGYDGWRYTSELDMTNPQKYPGHLPADILASAARCGGVVLWWLGVMVVLFSRRDLNCSA